MAKRTFIMDGSVSYAAIRAMERVIPTLAGDDLTLSAAERAEALSWEMFWARELAQEV